MCYNCLDKGHHQYECTKEPVCYKCKGEGHIAADCPTSGSKKLKMYGFGILGQGFYAFDLPAAKGKVSQATGILTILEGDADEGRVDKELKHLVREQWDFKVKNFGPNEFLVTFPDKSSLDTFSRLLDFKVSLYGLKGRLQKSTLDPETSCTLQTVWIQIHKVPGIAREVEVVKEIAAVVAEPLVVDELSLVRAGPVHVQARCKSPEAIHGSIAFYFNGEGIKIRFEVENPKKDGRGGKNGPSGPGKDDESKNRDKDGFHKGENSKRNTDKFSRYGKMDRKKDSSHGESMEDNLEGEKNHKQKMCEAPIAAFHPNVGMITVDLEFGEFEKIVADHRDSPTHESEEVELSPNDAQVVVHGAGGPYLMDKVKWPTLKLSSASQDEECVEILTQEEGSFNLDSQAEEEGGILERDGHVENTKGDVQLEGEDLMDNISHQSMGSDLDSEPLEWQTSRPKKIRKIRKKQVVAASRSSTRIPRDGEAILDKAMRRAQE